jgi:predicted phosphodiesterase
MRLWILADTHDELARAQAAVEMLVAAGAEGLVHCGDFTGPDILRLCRVLSCFFVFGNNDSDMAPALRQAGKVIGAVCLEWGGVADIAGKRSGVTHGHMTTDVRLVPAARPNGSV